MTERDDTSKGFLKRWSRKKIDAERETPAKAETKDVSPIAQVRSPERQGKNDTKTPNEAESKPEFDLASLPSLDSITAITDIRAFLTPGVPADLARAALRRAWAADPAIRDFKGLAENDWDFTDPTAMPGFGALPPGTDVKKLVAQIFGEDEKPADAGAGSEMPAPSPATEIASEIEPQETRPSAASDMGQEPQPTRTQMPDARDQVSQAHFVHRDNNNALHNSNRADESEQPKQPRQHGGALPQ
jgi:hypothetical protein